MRLRVSPDELCVELIANRFGFIGSTESSIGNVGQEMATLNNELTLQEVSMNQKAHEVRNAQQEYHRVLQVHAAREAKLRDYTDRK